jgi:hypothetical protein
MHLILLAAGNWVANLRDKLWASTPEQVLHTLTST